ncbi:TonB-dependent receptor plug domain-containing protein [Xanthomonas graminis]|jgi:iron complex outermembrane receptor protein|uniref:Ferric enterobactin receptor n=1 Tax=Xanthomonas graminis pv. graminis TaxID=134874 RepID=A0A1M4JFG4_9XANT|nr:TonB-dependent receptor [Xanthomonas translucens]EKU26126.1 TonB-dependent outer membrane receptor precursor [Xanthomonas translucens pv. graminis ART-Xtg29]OAX61820.1 ligand-gated channel [Xanthomonas translucens pv. graminis]UKE53598.1 TonB-dependent receptor [Xanthomonas translucens pv. graminis]WIH07913.1 TonB-dependent receptor [Xanthomonas translucens pv. graminis]WIH13328.1 TonB-dependent receptor [Xanthomonas translucens pv. graminis]
MNRPLSVLASAVLAALAAPPVLAQSSTDTPSTLDTVIVTGTRVSDRTVAESQSPIDIISSEALQSTGTSELATALSRVLPSLNFPHPALTDGTSGIRPAQLRGLSPDQVLVLVNGKRRHTSAQINVNGSIGRGASAVDINAIPIAAIERVEVLRDGASAQYGSDAIAGVINIVLKGASEGGSLAIDHGQYSAGDGAKSQLSGDTGIGFGDGRGSVHVAGQISQQDATNRAGPYQGSAPNTGNYPGIGETTFVYGDPQVDATAVAANGEFRFSDHVTGYATAIASNRDITSFAFYRSRNHNGQSALLAQTYPDGYVPQIGQSSKDRSLVAGLKGSTDGGFGWDVSYNYGYNKIGFNTRNSINYSLGTDSPSSFYDGALEYTQNIVNADFTQSLDWGLAYPVTLSFGTEYRQEKWNQSPGEAASYTGTTGGAQGFAGFSPANAVHADRHNYAVYAGLEADFTDKFSAGLTGRYEDYSDFGSKSSGKLSARYAFTDKLALRGTVASGFRAPSLAQQQYQAVTSSYINANFFESGTFPVDSAVAQALGAAPLKAETSLSYSLGLVLQPVERLYLTLDAYQIKIDDRILLSSNLNDAAVLAQLRSLGYSNVTSVRYFSNAADTRTRGVDLVGTYTIPFAASSLDLTASYGYSKTEITHAVEQPQALADIGSTQTILGRDEIGRLEDSFPKDKIVLSGTWKLQHWDLNLAATRYGDFTVRNSASAARDQTYAASWVVDASASFKPNDNWTLTLGADNLLDQYPDKTANLINATYGVLPYSNYSPYGFNGAYVYGRINYRW